MIKNEVLNMQNASSLKQLYLVHVIYICMKIGKRNFKLKNQQKNFTFFQVLCAQRWHVIFSSSYDCSFPLIMLTYCIFKMFQKKKKEIIYCCSVIVLLMWFSYFSPHCLGEKLFVITVHVIFLVFEICKIKTIDRQIIGKRLFKSPEFL